MSSYPADLRYTKSHEWLRTLPDGTIEVGITDHAQQALGDLVFVEVPEAGRHLAAGDACAVVESVKAASDVYSPIAGEVTSGNPRLATRARADQPRSLRRGLDHAAQARGRRRDRDARRQGLRGRRRRRRLRCPCRSFRTRPRTSARCSTAIGAAASTTCSTRSRRRCASRRSPGVPDALTEMEVGAPRWRARGRGRPAAQLHRRRRLRAPHPRRSGRS